MWWFASASKRPQIFHQGWATLGIAARWSPSAHSPLLVILANECSLWDIFAFLTRLFGQLWTALLALLGSCHWHNLGHTRKSTTEHSLVLGAGAVSLGKVRVSPTVSPVVLPTVAVIWHRIQLAHISSTLWRDTQNLPTLNCSSTPCLKWKYPISGWDRVCSAECMNETVWNSGLPRFGIIRISRAKQKRWKNIKELWFINVYHLEWRR